MIEWLEKTIDFSNVLNISITASWLILVVIGLRLVLKKAPKWVNVALWGIVAVRLLMPFSIESTLSLVPSVETVSDQPLQAEPAYSHQAAQLDIVTNPNYGSFISMELDDSMDSFEWSMVKMSLVWYAGIAVMSIYTAVSYFILRMKLRTAVILRDNLYQCETVSSPFVLGILKPRIYLPYGMVEQNLSHVIAHEQAHIRRKDHWWKPLGFMLLTIHWFNPLMWVAYILLCRDIELACDEKVIAELGSEQRADYTQALVACAVNRRMIAACPLAFGEVGVKERVKSIMNYRKPTFWIIVTALIVCAVVAVCFLTNPKRSTIYDIYKEDGYTVINQEEVDVTLYIDKAKLPDSIYTAEGYGFEENEVVVYSTETTKVYLYKAMLSNESDDLLYFIFDFSYDFPKSGSIISPYKHIGDQDGMQSNLYLKSKDLRDVNTSYPEALNIRGYGPGTQFACYVSKDACQAANRTLIIDIVCNQIVYAKEGHGYEHQHGSSSRVTKWFDYTEDHSGMSYEKELKIQLEEFPGITFKYTPYDIIATTSWDDGNTAGKTYLISGLPIWNAYFCDLTGDGKPEICSQVSYGSGMIDNRVIIHDYANGASYSLIDRGYHDYYLRMNASDGYLYVDKKIYNSDELVSSGRLVYKDGCIMVEETDIHASRIRIPTDTKLQGLHAGALLLPIDGKIYRYLISVFEPEGVTADELLFSFEESDLNDTIHWEVYSLQEYPDYFNVMVLSDRGDAWICCYFPPGACADTALEDAIYAGYVVMEDGIATHGQDTWKEFYYLPQQGKAASITVVHYFTLDPNRCDSAYYEVYSQDYPCLYEYHLDYDGKTFTLTEPDGNNVRIRTFEYLMKYDNTEFYSQSSKTSGRRFDYVLTHDNQVTWEQIWNGLVSSYTGAYIDHYSIYSERKY